VLAGPAFAQTGSLEIAVLDSETRDPLPGATVTLSSSMGLIAPTAVVSDEEGVARYPVLRAGGGYALDVSMPGFGTQRHADVRVRSNQTTKLAIQLAPEMKEHVQVVARSDIVDLAKPGGSTTFDDQFIDNLPVLGRFYQNVLSLAPGVNDADEDGNPNVHGARARNFQAQVSGVSNVDPLTGKWLSYINHDTIEEIELITYGAGAEFGRAQGGYARILQKQGSNEFEGVFGILYRSSLLDGDGAGLGLGQEAPEFQSYQPSIQISGPILRDRLWYRLSHEWISREDPINAINTVGITTTTQGIHSDQITWQVSPRNKLAFTYQYDPLTISNYDLSSAVTEESSRTYERGGPTYQLNWVAPVSARIIVDSRVAYQDHETGVRPTTPNVNQDCMIFLYYPGLNDANCYDTTLGLYSGSYPETFEDRRQRLTVRSDATMYVGRFLGGSHQVKMGFIVENERYYRELERRPYMFMDRYYFPIPPPWVVGDSRITAPVQDYSAGNARGVAWALYAEDQFQPSPGLSVRIGLRYDREEIRSQGKEAFDPQAEAAAFFARYNPDLTGSFLVADIRRIAREEFTAYENVSEFQYDIADILQTPWQNVPLNPTAGESSFWFHSREAQDVAIINNNLAPRFAVAWDPWNDGKTKFAATWGRYYDKIFLAVPLIELEPAEIYFSAFGEPFPFWQKGDIEFRDLLDALDPTASVRTVDRDMRTPYQDELSLSAERQLWPETSLKVSYVKRAFRDQLQDVDINHGPGGYTYNPGWGEILLVGNFNESDYTSYVFELVRRMYHGWELNGSYTWSEAVGSAEDFNQLLGNSLDLADTEYGYLSYDQRHFFRLNAVTIAPKGIRLGGTVRWQSGLPYSVLYTREIDFRFPEPYGTIGVPGSQLNFAYPTGRRNDQRNESYWNFDVRVAGNVKIARDVEMELTAEIFNLLNDNTLFQTDTVDGVFAGSRRFGRQYQLGLRLAF
jgi:outer membrane receptor protein involved in Fe transport